MGQKNEIEKYRKRWLTIEECKKAFLNDGGMTPGRRKVLLLLVMPTLLSSLFMLLTASGFFFYVGVFAMFHFFYILCLILFVPTQKKQITQ